MTKRDFVKERCDRTIEAFKNHELVDNREDRWRICKREKDGTLTNVHAAEIVSLWGGRLYVGGDFDDCVFAYYGDKSDHRSKLEWMGKCNDVAYYVRQKASMGLSDGGKLVDEFDDRVATEDLDYHRDELIAALDSSEVEEGDAQDIKEVFERAKELMSEPHEMCVYLYEELHDSDAWEWLGTIGNIVSYRVVYAWAAVRRLCELLDEKEADAIPR
jgi:hypothetical protein